MSLKFLEDWLLCMGGFVDTDGNPIDDPWRKRKPIKLATYDTRFIESVCGSIKNQQGLTDRQILLAIKIVQKYRRQWAQIGLDPSYLECDDIPLRLQQRTVDRTHAAWIENKQIFIKFPYDPKLIGKLNAAVDNPGNWTWHPDKKVWTIDLLECNIYYLNELKIFEGADWQLDLYLRDLLALSRASQAEAKQQPKLELINRELVLIDCADSLKDSMHAYGFNNNDIMLSALLANKHGVKISDSVLGSIQCRDPRRMLLESQFPIEDEYPGTSSMTWQKLTELMLLMPELNYVFLYRSNSMPRVIANTQHINGCSKEYITVKSGTVIKDSQQPAQSILITDILIGNPAMLELVQQHLGVLYMIADDERVDAEL